MKKHMFGSFLLLFLEGFAQYHGGTVLPDHACPSGWDKHLTRCYWYLDTEPFSWHQARDRCQELGGYLYVPSNDDEGVFIENALKKRDSFASISEAIWIGCEDKNLEGTFVCHEDAGDNGYRNWAYDEPNDSFGTMAEDCASAYTGISNSLVVRQWNDKDCEVKYNVVCERSGTNLNKITRTTRFRMNRDNFGDSLRVVPNQCLVEEPDLMPKGQRKASLIRCAVACADTPECKAFNFQRNGNEKLSNSSTSEKSKGTCQKLRFTKDNIKPGFFMTYVQDCYYYELELGE